MHCLLLFCQLQLIKVPKVKWWNESRWLVVYLTRPMELVILKHPLISYLVGWVIQLTLSMHEILVKTANIIPARWKIKSTLTLFLPLYIHGPDIFRLIALNFHWKNINLLHPFERYVTFRVEQHCLWVRFLYFNAKVIILSWRVMQYLLWLCLLLINRVLNFSLYALTGFRISFDLYFGIFIYLVYVLFLVLII